MGGTVNEFFFSLVAAKFMRRGHFSRRIVQEREFSSQEKILKIDDAMKISSTMSKPAN